MRIVHFVHQMTEGAAGVSAVVDVLVRAQRDLGHRVSVVTTAGGGDAPNPVARVLLAVRSIGSTDVVHLHALWISSTWIGAYTAMLRGRPYVLSPHGMLDPWALQRSHWKKRVARWLLEDRLIEHAGCVHALCEEEGRSVRRLYEVPVAEVTPGLDASWTRAGRAPEPARERSIVFLGRLHPKKGVDLLISAFHKVVRAAAGWRLVVAGPDQGEYRATLERLVDSLGLADDVSFLGPVYGQAKHDLLARAGLFALPSHSEGVPVAALEAMASGVPVVLSDACNLPAAAGRGAGWICSPTIDSLAACLADAMRCTPERRRDMGAQGRAWIAEEFTGHAMASHLVDVYRWVTGEAPMPEEVKKWAR